MVNESFYGSKSQWFAVRANDSDVTSIYQLANFTGGNDANTDSQIVRLSDKGENGVRFDTSIATAGMRNVKYNPFYSREWYNANTKVSDRISDTDIQPLIFMQADTNPFQSYYGLWAGLGQYYRNQTGWYENSENTGDNIDYYVKPVTSLNPQQIVLVPLIYASNLPLEQSESAAPVLFTVSAYFDTGNGSNGEGTRYFEMYPYIISVYAMAYMIPADKNKSIIHYANLIPFVYDQWDMQSGDETVITNAYVPRATGALVNTRLFYTRRDNNTVDYYQIDGYAMSLIGACSFNGNIGYRYDFSSDQYTSAISLADISTDHIALNNRLISWYWEYVDNTTKDDIREKIRQAVSHLGLFFAEDTSDIYDDLDSDRIFLGIIDADGFTTGNYSRGENNRDQPQFGMTDMIEESPYIPDSKPVDYGEEGGTELNKSPINNTTGIFTRSYLCDANDIKALVTNLYLVPVPDETTPSDYFKKMFLTENPIDCILSCMCFPFDLYNATSTQTVKEYVKLGNFEFKPTIPTLFWAVQGYPLANSVVVLDGGKIAVENAVDFRDFEPYTTYELYIPYHGTVSLNPSEFRDSVIGVKYLIDLVTGNSTAFIYRNNICVMSISGQMGAQIPVTGYAQSDYINSLWQSTQQVKAAKLGVGHAQFTSVFAPVQSFVNTAAGVASAAVSGDTAGAITTGITGLLGAAGTIESTQYALKQSKLNLESAKYQLQHTQHPIRVIGTSSPTTDFASEQRCRLIVTKYMMLPDYNPTLYGATTGFATYNNVDNLSAYSGLTQVSYFDTANLVTNHGDSSRKQLPATSAEKELVNSLMLNGVIL